MASWQPPIPSGALYSKPARQLGAGVALLAYLYDMVKTDGWVDVNLHDASVVIDAPYPTVKTWWQLIKVSSILAEVQDHGRRGIRAKFNDYWLDWRILSTRRPTPEPGNGIPRDPVSQSGTNRAVIETTEDPEVTEEVETVTNRELIGSETGSSDVPNDPAYKVLHTDQESLESSARKKRAEPPDHQRLMDAYQGWLGYRIPNGSQEGAAARKLLRAGYTIDQTGCCYQHLKAQPFYADKHVSLQTVYTQIGAYLQGAPNGQRQLDTHQQGGGSVVRNGHTGNGAITGDEANAAALARSGQRPDRAPLRRAKVDW